jgi:hypothetical protein
MIFESNSGYCQNEITLCISGLVALEDCLRDRPRKLVNERRIN